MPRAFKIILASTAALAISAWLPVSRLHTAFAKGLTADPSPPEAARDRGAVERSGAASSMKARGVKRVVLVSIDGLRPDAITHEHRAFHKLYLQGASPHYAHTINKSATLPSHASMVTGVDSNKHGIDFNAFKPERGSVRVPTVFTAAHKADIPATMIVGKSKLKHLLTTPADASITIAGMKCKRLVEEAMPTLRSTRQELVFLHFADPDGAGHKVGWMSEPYSEAVKQADACLERVLGAIAESKVRDQTLLIVTSDHGGHQRSHGTRLDVDLRIPWFALGAGVKRGRFSHAVHTTDTAATILGAFGLSAPAGLMGQAVPEALGNPAVPSGMPLLGKPLQRQDGR
jgi:arylsulfatase A-like enzyme